MSRKDWIVAIAGLAGFALCLSILTWFHIPGYDWGHVVAGVSAAAVGWFIHVRGRMRKPRS